MASTATLFLNGKAVGAVTRQGRGSSWGYGLFAPAPRFAEFSGLFKSWSALMHADESRERMSRDVLDRLRETERLLDQLDARLHWHNSGRWSVAKQVNIDGNRVEWKEGWADESFAAERTRTASKTVTGLPTDMAEQHDHYIHGTPKH